MLIHINTGKDIKGTQRMTNYFSGLIGSSLRRFAERITRLEVHVSDENSGKEGPDDKRCLIEARVRGLRPIAVTHRAETLDQAVVGATLKMKNALETTVEKARVF